MTGGVPVVVNGVPRVPNPEPVAPSEAINDLILVPVGTKVGLMYDEKTAERLLNDPVSRHLHQDFAQILVSQTVGEALDGLRRHPPQGRILYLYVVDDQGRLAGVVPTRRLLLAAPEQAVAEIMVRQVVALPARMTVLEACEFFIQHRFLAFPVVDEGRRLIGVVDVELYTDEVTELEGGRGRDDLFQLLGVHAKGARDGSPRGAFLRRFPCSGVTSRPASWRRSFPVSTRTC